MEIHKKCLLKLLLFIFIVFLVSCNIFYVSVRNIPVFFSSPTKISNKIKNPIHDSVRLSALWIGHSTILLQMDDKVIITDPLLTETAGMLARRVVEPGMNIEDIPTCDIILISHSHFDHLSLESLQLLEKKSKNAFLVFPDGVEKYLPDFDFKFVKMDNDNGYEKKYLGEQKVLNNVKISTVFAQHWGGRYALDGYVWGENGYTAYVIEYNGLTVYFSGDTGYDSTAFKKIGEMFNISLAFIPIGPCAECELPGTRNHSFPPSSLKIFLDLNAKWMIPIHYGTLTFAQAEPNVPVHTLKHLTKLFNIEDKVHILNIGEQKIYF